MFRHEAIGVYDETDKESAIMAFREWEKSLPREGLEVFRSLAKTVKNHFEDIFAYWDCTHRITNAYTECLNGLVKIANRMGRGYSYDIIRAKTLYTKRARKVGRGMRISVPDKGQVPTSSASNSVEYGPHIPTLVELAESGELD